MDENSTLMLKRYFKEYYFRYSSNIRAPSDVERREFGYLPFGGGMVRHQSYKDIGSLRAVLVKESPAGVYCSNSLYQEPTAEMNLKKWIKAELIFDIDADSLDLECKKVHNVWLCKGCGQKKFGLRPEICPVCRSNRILELSWVCSNCLTGTKKETYKLLDFLESDFGIYGDKIRVYFSGSAGYHVEVLGSEYEKLDTHGRGELADYLSANGLQSELMKSVRLSPNDPGWRGKIARYIRDLPPETHWFKATDLDSRVREFANDLTKKQTEDFLGEAVRARAVTIDAMVTTDIHRIFRMPETLNNKTGLVKRECRELSTFDPSREAVALYSSEKVDVMIDMCPKIELGGNEYGPFNSETQSLPMYVAIYLVAKGAAKVVSPATAIPASSSLK